MTREQVLNQIAIFDRAHRIEMARWMLHAKRYISDSDAKDDISGRGEIGRAERIVDAYIEVAHALSQIINDYKRHCIDQEIARLTERL